MSKIVFITYLPAVRPILVPKLKRLRIYWDLAHLIFQECWSLFYCQKWFLWNIYQSLCPNWSKMLTIYGDLAYLISILRPKLVQKLKVPRIEIEILKFGTFGISNMSISILMLKIIFMKYLLPVMLKLVQELKIHRVHWNLAHLILQACQK